MTGDLPTPVRNSNPVIRGIEYKKIEKLAEQKVIPKFFLFGAPRIKEDYAALIDTSSFRRLKLYCKAAELFVPI